MGVWWEDRGWADYLFWQTVDKKTVKRINTLIKDAQRNPYEGIGKPEPLKGNLSGFWSRRINEEDRLVYDYSEGRIRIISCKGHYE